jgi:predicted O-linked N-acetylglucosamine transferase (SPINDLY family)
MAVDLIGRAVSVRPDFAAAHANLALALIDLGRHAEAAVACRRAISLKPSHAEAHAYLGAVLRLQGELDAAASSYRTAVTLDPSFAQAHVNLGNVLHELGRNDEAVAAFRQATIVAPYLAEAHSNLGAVLKDRGEADEAIARLRRALALKPGLAAARWQLCMARLRVVYADAGEIAACRDAYAADLQALDEACRTDPAFAAASAQHAVGAAQPFFLPYQGKCDKDLQAVYGALAARLMARRHPLWATPPPPPARAPGEKLRIGFVSGYFHAHSVWKIPLRGWLEQLDRQKFRIFGYCTQSRRDEHTRMAERLCERFVQANLSVDEWCRTIRDDNPHVVIFPEIGMDAMTAKLAALRLAPVQATSWGHPQTSGLSTIDYFLSSDLMEPPDAEAHYTERLERLPNLSIHYTPPALPAMTATRAEIGARDTAVIYWCCQSLFKYLPQFDDVFPRIAREVGDCQFVFIAYEPGTAVTETMRHRLDAAFARHSLEYDRHCLFLPRLETPRFAAMMRLADVFLDSFEWSGCNSVLEALACELAVVTCPGNLMRGRHAAAILKAMDMGETIAGSVEDYIDIAVRLGRDKAWRDEVVGRIAANKHRLYGDTASIRALEEFLERVSA